VVPCIPCIFCVLHTGCARQQQWTALCRHNAHSVFLSNEITDNRVRSIMSTSSLMNAAANGSGASQKHRLCYCCYTTVAKECIRPIELKTHCCNQHLNCAYVISLFNVGYSILYIAIFIIV